MTTAATYAEFAVREAHGVSPTYERLSVAVSRDDEVLALLSTLPAAKRQPNLLFGVVRLLGGPVEDPAAFHDYAVTCWPAIEAEMRTRATQTNEAGRCAILLPVLATLPHTAGRSAPQRARAGRDTARLDPVARAGNQLVRDGRNAGQDGRTGLLMPGDHAPTWRGSQSCPPGRPVRRS